MYHRNDRYWSAHLSFSCVYYLLLVFTFPVSPLSSSLFHLSSPKASWFASPRPSPWHYRFLLKHQIHFYFPFPKLNCWTWHPVFYASFYAVISQLDVKYPETSPLPWGWFQLCLTWKTSNSLHAFRNASPTHWCDGEAKDLVHTLLGRGDFEMETA